MLASSGRIASGSVTSHQKHKSLRERWYMRAPAEQVGLISPGRLFKFKEQLYMVEALFRMGYQKYRPTATANIGESKKVLVHAAAMDESLINSSVCRKLPASVQAPPGTILSAYLKITLNEIKTWCDVIE